MTKPSKNKLLSTHSGYLLLIAAICLVVPCAVVMLTTGSFYYRHSSAFWDAVEEHQFNVHDRSADILFVGDSALLFGVIPQELRRTTGQRVYSLGVPMPALALNRESLIERYLAHNQAPRLMILYLSATMRSRPPFATSPVWYEGETMLMRYGRFRDIADFFSGNTEEITRFLTLALNRVIALDWSGKYYRSLDRSLDTGEGYVPPPLQSTLGAGSCPIAPAGVAPDLEFIQRFRRLAAEHGIAALVYLAPVPDCDQAFAKTLSSYEHLVDNVPYMLPHQLFVNDLQRVHLVPAGAQQNSRLVAAFLNRFNATQAALVGAR